MARTFPSGSPVILSVVASIPELAYLAGLIDGEGHVLVQVRSVALILCMADIPILDWCHEHFGGSLSSTWKSERGNSRPRRIWGLTRKRGLEEVARGLLPYLTLKRREVEIMLEVIEHGKNRPGANNPRFREWQLERSQYVTLAHAAMLARKTVT